MQSNLLIEDAMQCHGFTFTGIMPPRKIEKISILGICSVHGENGPGWPQVGPGGFFPTNPDLANILGRTDLDFENFYFFHVLDPKFLDFQVPRSPNSQISRFPDFQTPLAPALPDPDELSDPNLTPLPTHSGIKYVARALAATNHANLY